MGPAGADGANGRDGRDGRDGVVAGPPPPSVVLDMALDMAAPTPTTGTPLPIMKFSFGETNPTTLGSATGGAGAGKVNFSNVTVDKMLDAVTVETLRAAATGSHFSKVTIRAFNVGDSSPFAVYQFETAFVVSDIIGGNGNSLNETLTFVVGSITSDVTVNGTVYHSCWDAIMNRSC